MMTKSSSQQHPPSLNDNTQSMILSMTVGMNSCNYKNQLNVRLMKQTSILGDHFGLRLKNSINLCLDPLSSKRDKPSLGNRSNQSRLPSC